MCTYIYSYPPSDHERHFVNDVIQKHFVFTRNKSHISADQEIQVQIITVRQRSCGKVVFSQASVCSQGSLCDHDPWTSLFRAPSHTSPTPTPTQLVQGPQGATSCISSSHWITYRMQTVGMPPLKYFRNVVSRVQPPPPEMKIVREIGTLLSC